MKKEELLQKLRNNTHVQYDMPDLTINAVTYPDKVQQFIDMSKSVGSKVEVISEQDNVDDVVRRLYPEAKVIASNLPEVTIANINPDTVAEASDLNGTDVAVLKGEYGVAENGCIWIPQTMKEKAVCFISEELVIILHADKIVNNMHEGYKLIRVPEIGYGVWISGPSKTADIEQALVMGAQAARGVTILLIK